MTAPRQPRLITRRSGGRYSRLEAPHVFEREVAWRPPPAALPFDPPLEPTPTPKRRAWLLLLPLVCAGMLIAANVCRLLAGQ